MSDDTTTDSEKNLDSLGIELKNLGKVEFPLFTRIIAGVALLLIIVAVVLTITGSA